MRVQVLYFGVLRERFGVADEAAELPDRATVGELLGLLRGRTSNSPMSEEAGGADEQLWRSLAVAVNREYASASMVLHDGDEVALLPPVSGGYCARGEKLALQAKTSWAQALLVRKFRGKMNERDDDVD